MNRFKAPADAADWSRRDFMRNGSYSFALVCTFASTSSLKGAHGHDLGRTPLPGGQAVRAVRAWTCRSRRRSRRRRRAKGVDVYDVDIQEGLAEILPGFQTPIYGYEGIYPGPTIRARKGRTTIVRQKNRLTFDSNVHLHGGYVPAAHDGHPMDVIQPGKGFDYTYPNEQDAAFLWYHDHAHGRTAHTLYYGLVGTYLLGGRARGGARAADRRVRHPARARRPRVQQGRLVPLRGERRPRASAATRSSSTARSRRGWPSSAGSTGCGS